MQTNVDEASRNNEKFKRNFSMPFILQVIQKFTQNDAVISTFGKNDFFLRLSIFPTSKGFKLKRTAQRNANLRQNTFEQAEVVNTWKLIFIISVLEFLDVC